MRATFTTRGAVTLCALLLLAASSITLAVPRDAFAQASDGEGDDPFYEDDLEAETSGMSFDEEDVSQGEEMLVEGAVEAPPVEPPPSTGLLPTHRWHAGPSVGVGYNRMARPTDPAGSTTLLRGTAFAGGAFQIGAQAGYALWQRSSTHTLWLDLGAHYGWMRGSGFVENPERTKRQTVKLTGHTLRVPLMFRLDHTLSESSGHALFVGLGAEVLLGLATSAQVLFEQIAADPEPLYTTPVTHIGLLATLGGTFALREGLYLPVGLRLTYDPQVGDSTVERFEGYRSIDEPGSYQVAFDLHLHLVTGLEWRF